MMSSNRLRVIDNCYPRWPSRASLTLETVFSLCALLFLYSPLSRVFVRDGRWGMLWLYIVLLYIYRSLAGKTSEQRACVHVGACRVTIA
jgi:Ca2+/Na+ antiporter